MSILQAHRLCVKSETTCENKLNKNEKHDARYDTTRTFASHTDTPRPLLVRNSRRLGYFDKEIIYANSLDSFSKLEWRSLAALAATAAAVNRS